MAEAHGRAAGLDPGVDPPSSLPHSGFPDLRAAPLAPHFVSAPAAAVG